MLSLAFSLIAIIFGYYLLNVSPDASYKEVINRAFGGMILTIAGGVIMIIYIFRRSK